MNFKLLLLSFFLFPLLMSSCKTDSNKFTIVGEIRNMPEQNITLEEMGINDIKVLDSIKSDAHGHFELHGQGTDPGLYRLHFGENKFILLSIEKENVKVSGDWDKLEQYNVSGSQGSTSLRGFFENVRKHISDINTIGMVMDSMRMRGNDSLFEKASRQMDELNVGLTTFIENYADTTKHLPNALFAVQILNPGSEKPFLDDFVSRLPNRFPNQKLVSDYINHYKKAINALSPGEQSGPKVGSQAPEFSLNDPNGKSYTLASFKGKYILLDFWASWCTPCRNENPNVVAAFQKFKNKNFSVVGISLDNDKAKWQKAIQDDHLDWIQLSDLKGWESIAARDYSISSIPSNFLLDPNGKIIARDLRGSDLENELAKVLK